MSDGRLYYTDPYIKEFTSHITASRQNDGATWVSLAETAFYPEGGGQPADRGVLTNQRGSLRVTDVQQDEAGVIWHRLQSDISEVGAPKSSEANANHISTSIDKWFQLDKVITGAIDWQRRFDHMQQHCGQHILSEAFVQVMGVETVSFHLGEEYCSIDLNCSALSSENATTVEALANQVVWSSLPVEVVWVDAKGAKEYRLRKTVDRQTDIRIVVIGDFDHSGCGGTHPNSTAQVGLIKITCWEKTKGNTRVSFLCGNRALADYQVRHEVTVSAAQTLGLHWHDINRGIGSLQEQLAAAMQNAQEKAERIAALQAHTLLPDAERIGVVRIVQYCAPTSDGPDNLRLLGQQLVAHAAEPFVAFMYTQGEKPHVILMRNGKPGDTGPNVAELLRPMLAAAGGRGGGSAIMAQGGMPTIEAVRVLMDKVITRLNEMPVMQEGW